MLTDIYNPFLQGVYQVIYSDISKIEGLITERYYGFPFIRINEPSYQVVPGFGKSFFGGKCAAPVFKNIMERSLKFLGIEPDDPYGYPKGDPRANEELADYSQEIKDLKKQFHEWN